MKKYNFNAGPSMLPREVVEQTAAAVLDYNGMGLSLMELSHRSAEFKPILDEARALLKELLDVPQVQIAGLMGQGRSADFDDNTFMVHRNSSCKNGFSPV